MRIKQILCPIDFSRSSDVANIYASMLAHAWNAKLIYLNALYPPLLDSSIEGELSSMMLEFKSRIKPLVQGVGCEYEIKYGRPEAEIVAIADERKVDLIVLGTHGRTGAKRLLYGSVCEQVLRHAHCPVMAVKSRIGKRTNSKNTPQKTT